MIDIEALHTVAEGSLFDKRQVGHTFLSVTYLASLVSISEPVIYCFVDSYIDVQYIKKLVFKVFNEYELPRINWIGMLHFTCNRSKVFFRSNHIKKFSIEGLPANAVVVLMFNEPLKNFQFIEYFNT